jgi:hypothetical protein
VDWRPPLADVIDAVHAQGGVAIAAHPAAPRIETYEDKAVLQRLDGIEGPPPMIRRENPRTARTSALYSEALSANPNVGIVGASDYHLIAPVGAYRTFLLVHERSAAGIVEAIRAGRTAACSPRGRTYGNEALVLAVREDCVATASGAHAPNRWSRAAFGCTWLALLTLAVVTGPVRERPA